VLEGGGFCSARSRSGANLSLDFDRRLIISRNGILADKVRKAITNSLKGCSCRQATFCASRSRQQALEAVRQSRPEARNELVVVCADWLRRSSGPPRLVASYEKKAEYDGVWSVVESRGEEENAKNTFLRVRPYGASRSNLYLTISEINPTFSSSVRSPGSSRT
jgi:hypothetical protein